MWNLGQNNVLVAIIIKIVKGIVFPEKIFFIFIFIPQKKNISK